MAKIAFFVQILYIKNYLASAVLVDLKPGFHKASFDHDSDQFSVKTKRLLGRMTAQPIIALFFVSWWWSLL